PVGPVRCPEGWRARTVPRPGRHRCGGVRHPWDHHRPAIRRRPGPMPRSPSRHVPRTPTRTSATGPTLLDVTLRGTYRPSAAPLVDEVDPRLDQRGGQTRDALGAAEAPDALGPTALDRDRRSDEVAEHDLHAITVG